MTNVDLLLAGPRGRSLCVKAADACSEEFRAAWFDVVRGLSRGWRVEDAVVRLLPAVESVRSDQVSALPEETLEHLLEETVEEARYWQPPDADEAVWAHPDLVSGLRPIAAAVLAHQAAAWWSEGPDTDARVIARLLHGDEWPPAPDLHDTTGRLRRWRERLLEREAQHDPADRHWRITTGQWWSTPVATGVEWTSADRGDRPSATVSLVEDSLGWTEARVFPVGSDDAARVRVIRGPEDWAALVDEYPLEVSTSRRGDWWRTTGRDGRWFLPDWVAVAGDHDAVHVTPLAWLASAGRALPVADGATVLAGWGPGHTLWLRPECLRRTGPAERWSRLDVQGTAWRRDDAVTVRPLAAAETPLLADATLMNVNWTGEQRFTATDVAAEPSLAHYTVLHARRGDEALVAVADGEPIGLVWYLFLDRDDPGFGYVADDVPELSVCVWPGRRGAGVGERLVADACALAAARGIRRMSLSVESGNPARRLYERLGFAEVPGAAEGTMVREL